MVYDRELNYVRLIRSRNKIRLRHLHPDHLDSCTLAVMTKLFMSSIRQVTVFAPSVVITMASSSYRIHGWYMSMVSMFMWLTVALGKQWCSPLRETI